MQENRSKIPIRNRDASVQIKDDWVVVEEMDFPRLTKLNLPDIKDGEDLWVFLMASLFLLLMLVL